MQFIGHSVSTAVNTGKIYFTKNPMAINYLQWIAFSKYSYKQLNWALLEKSMLIDACVRDVVREELMDVYEEVTLLLRSIRKIAYLYSVHDACMSIMDEVMSFAYKLFF